jgi:hypothetical protein
MIIRPHKPTIYLLLQSKGIKPNMMLELTFNSFNMNYRDSTKTLINEFGLYCRFQTTNDESLTISLPKRYLTNL